MSLDIYSQIETLKKVRLFTLDQIKDLTTAQLNQVPEGFNNNIIWNVAHLIAAQQGSCYKRAEQPMIVSEQFFEAYKPGSKPETVVSANEITTIKQVLLSCVDQLENDLRLEKFNNYTPWTNRYGVDINNINDILNFLPFHDGTHLGYIMALKRLV